MTQKWSIRSQEDNFKEKTISEMKTELEGTQEGNKQQMIP